MSYVADPPASHFVDGELFDAGDAHHITTIERLKDGRVFLEDKEYADALERRTICCLDAMAVHGEAAFNGLRRNAPHLGGIHWLGGGRNPGETPAETALRHAKRDYGLDTLSPERIEYLRYDSWAWWKEPASAQHLKLGRRGGCHMDSYSVMFELADPGSIVTQPDGDFSEGQWYEVQEIANFTGWKVHPVLRHAARQVLGQSQPDGLHYVDGQAIGEDFIRGTAGLRDLAEHFLSAEAEDKLLWGKVVGSVAVAILHQGAALVVNRSVPPLRGGLDLPTTLRTPGESFQETGVRCLAEFGIVVSPEQFRFARADSCVFGERPPSLSVGDPWHTDRVTLVVDVTAQELNELRLPAYAEAGLWPAVRDVLEGGELSDFVRSAIASSLER